MLKLYIDEDSMQRSLVRALRARGIDVLTALEAGMLERPDEEHLRFATEQGRVLYTFNIRDFYRLHTEYMQRNKHHAGIILAKQQHYSIGAQLRALLNLVATKAPEDMHDRVEFLSAWE